MFFSPEGSQSRFLDVGLKASLDGGVRRIGSDSLTNFLVFSLNVSGDGISYFSQLSEWPTQQQAQSCPCMICCGDFFEVYVKFATFSFQSFRKRVLLVVSDTESRGWVEIGNVGLESGSQIFEETRIENLQVWTVVFH